MTPDDPQETAASWSHTDERKQHMDNDRSEYTAGLRALAALLDQHPEVPLPYGCGTSADYSSDKVAFYCHSKDEFLAFARAFPGRLDKRVDEGSVGFGFELHGALRGLSLYAAVARGEVCRRVVTGTREVTEAVPDPDALAAVPTTTVTRTVEDVEWVCEPLLAEAATS